jgi:putative peptidoglycan lipid II flippase
VMQIPLGVIGFPLGVVLLPSLARAVASGSVREFGRMVVGSVRMMLYLMLFITAVGIVLRRQVVTLLFDYGLDERAISLTADTLSFFLLGLGGFSMVIVFARAFYSGHDTRTPVISALFDMATSITIATATVGSLGLPGIALGLAAGGWAESTALGVLLWRRTPGANLESIIKPMFVFAIGAGIAGAVAAVAIRILDAVAGPNPGKLMLFAELIIASSAAAAVYAVYSLVLRIPELTQSIDLARSTFRRRRGSA